jgi:DNA-binding FadR family transcriptional regulator
VNPRTATVLDTLRDEILTGQYRPGERLPSERELAARFETSRGAVREALKKLEQLGIAAIHKGGVRVVAVEEATLEVIGPILDLQAVPDAILADQIVQVLSLLVIESARDFVRIASREQIEQAEHLIGAILVAEPGSPEALERRMDLGRHFMETCGNLPMRLIANGLRIPFADKMRARGFAPQPEPIAFRVGMLKVKDALGARDADAVAGAMREVMQLNRRALREALEAAGATRRGLGLIPAPPSRGLER